MNPPIGDRVRVAERLNPVRHLFDRASRWANEQAAFRHRIPIRGRIALFGAAVVALTVVIFSALVYVLVERSLYSQQDAALSRRGDVIWSVVQSGRGLPSGPQRFAGELSTSIEPLIEVFDTNGTPKYWTETINGIAPQMPFSLFQSASERGATLNVTPDSGPLMRVYVRAVKFADIGVAGYVLIGQPQSAIQGQLEGLRLFLIAGALLSLI